MSNDVVDLLTERAVEERRSLARADLYLAECKKTLVPDDVHSVVRMDLAQAVRNRRFDRYAERIALLTTASLRHSEAG